MSIQEKISIPLNKTYFSTFLNNFQSITYLNDKTTTLDSLKLLLFPIEFSDQDYNNLCAKLKKICDESIKENKEKEEIESYIKTLVDIEDEFSKVIVTSIINKKAEIIEYLNSKFNNGFMNMKNLEWKTKSILASSKENYLNERFADLEFTVFESNNCSEGLEKLKTSSITFNKADIGCLINKLSSLSDNLQTIKKLMNKSDIS